MSFDISYALEDGLVATLNFFPFLFGIVSYILTSLGLYTFAKRRMIRHAWMSWVPVADLWILGSLSDQYRYVAKGQNKSKRKILLVLSILSWAAVIGVVLLAISSIFNLAAGAIYGVSEAELFEDIMGTGLGAVGLILFLLPVAITLAVFRYMALYDLYLSCDPDNAVLFLVLSIVVHVTTPFFIFCNRNRDRGMPPRRDSQYASGYQPSRNNGYQPQNSGYQPQNDCQPQNGGQPQSSCQVFYASRNGGEAQAEKPQAAEPAQPQPEQPGEMPRETPEDSL